MISPNTGHIIYTIHPCMMVVWGPDLFSEGGGGRENEVWRLLQHFRVLLECQLVGDL